MRICMISGESNPFLKTGGLGDVVYSLSKKLVTYKHPTSIIMPYYRKIACDTKGCILSRVADFNVKMNWRNQSCQVFKTNYEGINFYFIKNDQYFTCRDDAYGYDDDAERFAFFQLAAMQLIHDLKLPFDVIHVHDWQSSMIPLIYHQFYENKLVRNPKFILTIHNSLFIGYTHRNNLYDFFNISTEYYDNGLTRFNDSIGYLKTGIMTADKVTTVSPTHAEELLKGWDGSGLQGSFELRRQDLSGIINGIDTKEWDPRIDPMIRHNYSIKNALQERSKCKEEFAKALGFAHPEYPLFVCVSRLSYQKGIDLITGAIPELVRRNCNIYILGTGQKEIENEVLSLQARFPENVVAQIAFRNDLAHIAYSSADFFLIPSRYEPCGLTQMYSHRYGAIPLARATGGLVDSIIAYNGNNEDVADGILFNDYSLDGFLWACNLAINLYYNQDKMNKIIHNGMKANHTWTKSFKEYVALYKKVVGK